MAARRVVVTGLGQVSAHGRDVAAGFEALLCGHGAAGLHRVGEAPHETSLVSTVCQIDDAAALLGRARVNTMDRVSQLSALAAQSAWADAGLDAAGALNEADRDTACVMWGSGAGGLQTTERAYRELFVKGKARISPLSVVMAMHNAAASHVALAHGLGGACLSYAVACASSSVAIAEALRRLRWGECELALAGGAEAALPYGSVKAWQSMQVLAGLPPDQADEPDAASRACRPFDLQRRGLVLGEGSACLVLESLEHAQARGARIYAELAGAGQSCDARHLSAPQASGQLRALQAALRDAGATPGEVGYVNAHGTATAEGDPVEIEALRQLFGHATPGVALSATKSMTGHLMGAAGALEALITVMALHTGHLPPTAHLEQIDPLCAGPDHLRGPGRRHSAVRLALSNSFAFGGSNAVLVFRRLDGMA